MSIIDSLRRGLRDARRQRRRIAFRFKSILIRQVARKAFDLPRFGDGAVERMLAALIFSTVFFFVFLGLAQPLGLQMQYGLGLAGFALLVALGTSALLILAGSDAALETDRAKTKGALLDAWSLEAKLAGEIEDELDVLEADRDERERRKRSREVLCPFCRDLIRADALKCKHCGEILDPALREERSRERSRGRFNPGIAALLSFLIPGLGQIYKGQVASGMLWFFFIAFLYGIGILTLFCVVGLFPLFAGLAAWILCIFDAASG